MKITLFLFFTFNLLTAQKRISILESNTNNPIELSSIDFLDNKSGTFSNAEGIAYVPVSIDSVKVSCLGYTSLNYHNLKNNDTIYLNKKNIELNEIVLNNNFKEVLIDNKKEKKRITISCNNSGVSLYKKIKNIPKSYLKNVSLNIYNNEDVKNCILEVLTSTKDNLPDENEILLTKSEILETNQNYLSFDLSDNYVLLDQKNYFFKITIIAQNKTSSSFKTGVTIDNISCSLTKPYFNKSQPYQNLPKVKKKKYYNFNLSITIEQQSI